MTDVLSLALEHAKAYADADPERRRLAAERRKQVDERASEIYAALEPLASKPVRWNGKDGRLQIALFNGKVTLSVMERERYQAKDASIRLRDSRALLVRAAASVTPDGVMFSEFGGASKGFAQIGDLVKHVAAIVGPMLVVEEL